MHKAVIVILSLCWVAIFSALSVIGLTAAVDGISVAKEAMPVAAPLLGITPLATPALMGGLSLGSAVVTALFCWMLLTALLVDENPSRGIDNPIELAHGGAFGIAGVIFLTTILDASPPIMVASAMMLGVLVLSLMLSRAAPEPAPIVVARHVRDRAIEAAHLYSTGASTRSAEIVQFPLRGEFAGRGSG